jgi:homoserine dehydrogenase
MLAKVDGVYNAVEVDGNLCGRVLFHGRGAGREPTASAVVGDLVEIARRLDGAGPPPPVVALERPWPIRPIGDLRSRYYLRLTVADRPGVLAQIAHILGESQISIAAVVQKDTNLAEQTAELVITTHVAQEAAIQRAMKAVAALDVVRRVNNLLRIEE